MGRTASPKGTASGPGRRSRSELAKKRSSARTSQRASGQTSPRTSERASQRASRPAAPSDSALEAMSVPAPEAESISAPVAESDATGHPMADSFAPRPGPRPGFAGSLRGMSLPGLPQLVGVAVAVILVLGLVLSQQSIGLEAARDRLERIQSGLNAGDTPPSTAGLEAELAAAKRAARICRDGLTSMVTLWNRYMGELKALDSGRQRFRAAERRMEIAKKQARTAIRRCDQA